MNNIGVRLVATLLRFHFCLIWYLWGKNNIISPESHCSISYI